jgi:hypothetical protein
MTLIFWASAVQQNVIASRNTSASLGVQRAIIPPVALEWQIEAENLRAD